MSISTMTRALENDHTDIAPRPAKIFDRSMPPTPTEVDWASSNLADLPAILTFSDKPVTVWQDDTEGATWRKAGVIVASPGDKNRFNVHVYAGATTADLDYLTGIISQARAGRFARFGWTKDDRGCYVYSSSREWGPARQSAERYDNFVIGCTEPNCLSSSHEVEELERPCYEHVADRIGGVCSEYTISVTRSIAPAVDTGWTISIETGDEPLTGEQARRFATDLQWFVGEARKLNRVLAEYRAQERS